MLTALNGNRKRNGDLLLNCLRLWWSTARLLASASAERIAASGPTAHASSAAHLAKDILHPATAKQLTEIEIGSAASTAERVAASLKRISASAHAFEFRPELIVHFAFFGIAQHIVSLLDFLELLFGPFLGAIIRVFMQVRVILTSQLFMSFVNLVRRSAARQTKNLIVIVCH